MEKIEWKQQVVFQRSLPSGLLVATPNKGHGMHRERPVVIRPDEGFEPEEDVPYEQCVVRMADHTILWLGGSEYWSAFAKKPS